MALELNTSLIQIWGSLVSVFFLCDRSPPIGNEKTFFGHIAPVTPSKSRHHVVFFAMRPIPGMLSDAFFKIFHIEQNQEQSSNCNEYNKL